MSRDPSPSAPSAPAEGGGPVVRLGTTGPIYVTHAAARSLMRALGHPGDEERARKLLLALAHDARPVDTTVSPERWRSRRRSHGIDVTLSVVRERPAPPLEPIAVVVACEARPHRAGR